MSAYSNWKVGRFKSKTELIDAPHQDCQEDSWVDLTKRDPTMPVSSDIAECHHRKGLDIFATQLLRGWYRLTRDSKRLLIFSRLTACEQNLKSVPLIKGFTSSLHAELVRNFDTMWPSLGGIKKFSRATQVSMSYGQSYLYDLDILDRVLSGQGCMGGLQKGSH